ncbi:hypothetical protein SADUNF_Sadunf01G0034300 [Salix dunnii]|uniref:Uncharacterized protein n=1 Tax=Salix dunnii TaxID=1413687 RepID=A0A835N9T0_9ROSI|nr:hypothetical protein SADUNF_Sadunf01G0034300 [Salix dunnii]
MEEFETSTKKLLTQEEEEFCKGAKRERREIKTLKLSLDQYQTKLTTFPYGSPSAVSVHKLYQFLLSFRLSWKSKLGRQFPNNTNEKEEITNLSIDICDRPPFLLLSHSPPHIGHYFRSIPN